MSTVYDDVYWKTLHVENQDKSLSMIDGYDRKYFEVDILKGGNSILLMKTNQDCIIYNVLKRDLVSGSTNLVYPCSKVSAGSLIGVNMWKIQKNGVPQTLVEFSIMKDSACTKPILLKGSNIVSKVYYDPNEGMLFYLNEVMDF